jgi:hypothetical protein
MSKASRQRRDERQAKEPAKGTIITTRRIVVGFWGTMAGYPVNPQQAGELCRLLELEPDEPFPIGPGHTLEPPPGDRVLPDSLSGTSGGTPRLEIPE